MTMPRLATHPDRARDAYDAVVVGSGYGGAVVAARLARAGRTVCLLERGREVLPGEFPRTFPQVLAELAGHPVGHAGPGLFDLRRGPGRETLAGCGLGGASLVNAGVLLEPDAGVLGDNAWPATLRGGTDPDWLEGLRRARETLRPAPVPDDAFPVPRLDALALLGGTLGLPFRRAPASIRYAAEHTSAGAELSPCRLCGDCCTGCNHGAKASLDALYVAEAVAGGAHVFVQSEVVDVERSHGSWVVRFVPVGPGRGRFDAQPMFVRAAVVVLAAGTPGSPGILMRSRANGLAVSGRLGDRVSANGTSFGFAWDTGRALDGIGANPEAPRTDRATGPATTGLLDGRAGVATDQGVVLLDAAFPGALAAVAAHALAKAARSGTHVRGTAGHWLHEAADRFVATLFGPDRGAAARTLALVATGHDLSPGRVLLDGDHALIAWPARTAGGSPADDLVRRAAQALGGTVLQGIRLPVVHAVGGCPMADRAEDGVVDASGRVFAGSTGADVHDGLYVVDGSIVPRSLGVPPSLTIAALAERASRILLRQRGWTGAST